jgi:uncharacterized protein YndB with AHSA1/START domain
VITVSMATTVSADRGRVWFALTDPAELIRWDERLVSLLEPPDEAPHAGQRVRWRYKLGSTTVVLRNELIEVVPGERLRSSTSLGLFRFDETFTLCSETGDSERTRLRHKLVAENSIPIVGGLLDRFAVRRLAAQIVDSKLRSLQKWCENQA